MILNANRQQQSVDLPRAVASFWCVLVVSISVSLSASVEILQYGHETARLGLLIRRLMYGLERTALCVLLDL